jgi:hypothetical protein
MKTKQQLRNEIISDIARFISEGNTITLVATRKHAIVYNTSKHLAKSDSVVARCTGRHAHG